MDEEDGKLKYIGGIPYLSSRQIRLTQPAGIRRWWERVYLHAFSGRFGNVLLWLLLLTAALGAAALIDLIILSLT